MTIELVLTIAVAAGAAASAYCWVASARAFVPAVFDERGHILNGTLVTWTTDDGRVMDLAATMKRQTKWNSRAAMAAAATAILQVALALLLVGGG